MRIFKCFEHLFNGTSSLEKIDFQWMHLFCVATKYLVLLQLAAVPVHQRDLHQIKGSSVRM